MELDQPRDAAGARVDDLRLEIGRVGVASTSPFVTVSPTATFTLVTGQVTELEPVRGAERDRVFVRRLDAAGRGDVVGDVSDEAAAVSRVVAAVAAGAKPPPTAKYTAPPATASRTTIASSFSRMRFLR